MKPPSDKVGKGFPFILALQQDIESVIILLFAKGVHCNIVVAILSTQQAAIDTYNSLAIDA